MAFIDRENALRNGQIFVKKLSDGIIFKDHLVNHGSEFKGDYESLAHATFVRYIGSASYALMQSRRGRYFEECYRGY